MNDRAHPPAFDPARLARNAFGTEASPREAELYVRYLRALALLCECVPYVDEPDYIALIDAMLDDAHGTYAIEVRKDETRREVALRGVLDE